VLCKIFIADLSTALFPKQPYENHLMSFKVNDFLLYLEVVFM